MLLGTHWHGDAPGGMNRYLADLFGALQGAGLDPRAVVAGPAADAPQGVVASGHYSRPFPIRLISYTRAVRRTAATVNIAVVDAHFAFYAFWPVVVGRLRGYPLVVHFQGPWADESVASGEARSWRIAVKRKIESSVYGRACELVVISDAYRRLLIERYQVAPWCVNVVPPGVDLARFAPGDRVAARAALALPDGTQAVVAVRRMVPRMGLDILIRAWAGVVDAIPEAVLLVVGDGPERTALERRAGPLTSRGSVRFLGRVDDETVVRCYQAADLSAVPSIDLEGYGLVVLESLACGTPALVTDVGGLPEAIAPLDASLVVPAGDPESLARRLITALDGSRPAPDRDRCRSHAELHAWTAVAERHRAIYARASRPGERKLRVVYLDHCARLSGGELALLHLVPALAIDAHVILGEDGPMVAKLRAAGVSVEVLALADAAASFGRERVRPGRIPLAVMANTADYIARLARRLHRLGPDLVHTNSLKSALYGGVAARLASIPVIWHVRDRIADDYLPSAARRIVSVAAGVLPAAIIANSKSTMATLGRAGAGGTVIADPLGFASAQSPRAPSTDPLRVGILGRLDPWKGQHVFLDAFAKAFPDGPEEAVIVGASLFGTCDYDDELRRQVVELGVAGRVEFRGFRERVDDELGRLDVLVHASTIPEPFGQVVVEGLAAGLPVVAADAGGPAEVITSGVNGLLYRPGDATALSHELRRLAADPGLRQRLAEAGLRRSQDYTADRIAPEVMTVYQRVAAAQLDA